MYLFPRYYNCYITYITIDELCDELDKTNPNDCQMYYGEYYLVGHKDISLEGLKIRIRK